MKIPNLLINVQELYADQPPRRQLVLTCNITNSASYDICILDAWVKVEALNSLKLTEGKLFQSMHNSVDPAIIPQRKDGIGSGSFHIDLPPQVLQRIEEQRAGGDVKLFISSRVLVSEVFPVNNVKVLGVPFETEFENAGSGRFEHVIPQSEWIKLLKNLAWSELEVLELPTSGLRQARGLGRIDVKLSKSLRSDSSRRYWKKRYEQSTSSVHVHNRRG